MKITINDERIGQVIPVALENIKVDIVEAKPQTFQTMDDKGDVVETTLNIVQPAQITTIKETDADISNLESQLSQAQVQVGELTAELQKKRDLRGEMETVVTVAFNDLQIAIQNKE